MVNSVNFSTVNLTWEAPENPNGIIGEYRIKVTHHKVNLERLLDLRNYCDESSRLNFNDYVDSTSGQNGKSKNPSKEKSTKNPADFTGKGNGLDGSCDCTQQCGSIKPINGHHSVDLDQNEKVEESQFHDELLNSIYTMNIPTISSRRKKRSTTAGSRTNTSNLIYIDKKSGYSPETELENPEGDDEMTTEVFSKNVTGNLRQLMITNLTHFSKYTVTIEACHSKEEYNLITNTMDKKCSKVASLDFRTDRKPGADDILNELKSNQGKNNGTDIWITWDDPKNPNLAIVYYKFQIWMQNDPSKKKFDTCMSAKEFNEQNRRFTYGSGGSSFYVKVRAFSLAGPGAWTQELLIRGKVNNQTVLWSILVPVLMILAGAAVFVVYLYYKKQRPRGDETTLNPIYCKVRTSRQYWLAFGCLEFMAANPAET